MESLFKPMVNNEPLEDKPNENSDFENKLNNTIQKKFEIMDNKLIINSKLTFIYYK